MLPFAAMAEPKENEIGEVFDTFAKDPDNRLYEVFELQPKDRVTLEAINAENNALIRKEKTAAFVWQATVEVAQGVALLTDLEKHLARTKKGDLHPLLKGGGSTDPKEVAAHRAAFLAVERQKRHGVLNLMSLLREHEAYEGVIDMARMRELQLVPNNMANDEESTPGQYWNGIVQESRTAMLMSRAKKRRKGNDKLMAAVENEYERLQRSQRKMSGEPEEAEAAEEEEEEPEDDDGDEWEDPDADAEDPDMHPEARA